MSDGSEVSDGSRLALLNLHRDRVNALLQPGERAFTMQWARMPNAGSNRLGRTREDEQYRLRMMPAAMREAAIAAEHRQPRPRNVRDRIGDVVSWILTPTWPWDRWDWTRLWAGLVASGSAGSQAHRLWSAIDRQRTSPALIVTDRRLVLVEQPSFQADRFEQLLEIPRAEVVRARRRDRLFSHGRLRIDFADGSMITLLPGIFSPRPARKLAKALSSSLPFP